MAKVNGHQMLSPWQCKLSAYVTIDGSDQGLPCAHAISMTKRGLHFGQYILLAPLLTEVDHDPSTECAA